MPKETQRGYLSGVLQRGARIVRGMDSNHRTPFGADQGRVSASPGPVIPLELETFTSSHGAESHVLGVKPAPAKEIQSNVSPSSDPANASQKLDAGHRELALPTRPIETNPSSPRPPSSVRVNFPSRQVPSPQTSRAAAESFAQTSGAVEPPNAKASNVDRPAQIVESDSRQNEVHAAVTKSPGENRREANSSWTGPFESKGPPSFRIRDGYLRGREILRERKDDATNFKASAATREAESNSLDKSQSGPSSQPALNQLSARALPEKADAESFLPRRNSASAPAELREALEKDGPSRALVPRVESVSEVLEQPFSVPRFEAGTSQRPAHANSMSPDASPKLTINRLDIQIIDQTPQPAIVVPMRPTARSEGAENIDRYQLGHIDLIF